MIQNIVTQDLNNEFAEIKNEAILNSLLQGRAVEICARGQSMYPFIKDYDILKVCPLNNVSLNLGDIVLVKPGNLNKYFIHRLIVIKHNKEIKRFYVKGDNLSSGPEGPFTVEQILGKVVSIKRKNFVFKADFKRQKTFQFLTAYFSCNIPNLFKIISRIFCLFYYFPLLPSYLSARFHNKDLLKENTKELLIILATHKLDQANMDKPVSLVREGIRWNYFYELSLSSGKAVAIIKQLNLLKAYIDVPNYVLEKLTNLSLAVIYQASHSHEQLKSILRYFYDRELPVVALKGTVLAKMLYGDIDMRGGSCDIDLLINEPDKDRACIFLESMGYHKASEQEVAVWCWHYDLTRSQSFPIDLHWDVTMMRRSKGRLEILWKNIRPDRIFDDDFACSVWPREIILPYLCVQLVNSCGYRNLKILFDIREIIINSGQFNWSMFVSNTRVLGWNNSVYAGLSSVSKILGVDLPDKVLLELKAPLIKRIIIALFLNKKVFYQICLRRKILDGFLSFIFYEIIEANTVSDYIKIVKKILLSPQQEGQPAKKPWQYLFYLLKRLLKGSFKTVGNVLKKTC
jgi:hypothetical protein